MCIFHDYIYIYMTDLYIIPGDLLKVEIGSTSDYVDNDKEFPPNKQ